ncbi:MAG: hypothetical protein ABI534_02915 [Chloroflexota bacterium]
MTASRAAIGLPIDEPALRDAARVSERIALDEAAAEAAREGYRVHGLPRLSPEGALDLEPDELVHAHRPAALLEHSSADSDSHREPGFGALWVTSRRLVHAGPSPTSVRLEDIDEMAVAVGRLLLARLRNGAGLAIETDQPRLLRVVLAAAIEVARQSER